MAANYGDQVDDPQIALAGKRAGLQVWRVEDFKLAPVEASHHGSFYSGDAYLVMKTTVSKSSRKTWDLHFWLGKDSSQDEQGAAAILAVQMDDYLGGEPTQYRETEGNESKQFKSYFKTGIIYKNGGVASGFNHVRTNDFSQIKRLLHVKGKRNVVAKEVKFSWDSFNRGDSFIIDTGSLIIVFNAAESNRQEQMKANILAKDIRDRERAGRAKVEIVDGKSIIRNAEDPREEHKEIIGKLEVLFGAAMPRQFAAPTKDDNPSLQQASVCKLFQISDETGEIRVQEVATSPLQQKLLLSQDCYLVDQGSGQKLYIWKGKNATTNERKQSMSYATQYMQARGYNSNTQVEVNNDGGESAMFKQLFSSWKNKWASEGRGEVYTVGKVAKQSNAKFDASVLHADPGRAATSRMPDNGEGEVIVWRVENDKLHRLKEKSHGQFFTGDSYLVLYTYNKTNREAHIIYIWQGLKSPEVERGASAFLAVQMDDHFHGEPVQVRIEQGHEPRHFLEIFKGKLVIHNGGYDHVSKMPTALAETRMYHVRGSATYNTKAVETSANVSKLNSNDCFVVIQPSHSVVWCGKGSNGDEREMAKNIAVKLSDHKNIDVVAEGHEDKNFWQVLGGKTQYQNTVNNEDYADLTDYQGRLFECSNASGRFTVEEVLSFEQSDLDPTDVMLLDAWECIFMWVGLEANQEEKLKSVQAASDYLATHPAGRHPNTPLITVKQGYEPFNFTGWFQAWDPEFWGPVKWDPFIASDKTVESGVAKISLDQKNVEQRKNRYLNRGDSVQSFIPYEKLRHSSADELPPTVDLTKKENYLSPEEFEDVFNMSKTAYDSKKSWQRDMLKKQVGLF